MINKTWDIFYRCAFNGVILCGLTLICLPQTGSCSEPTLFSIEKTPSSLKIQFDELERALEDAEDPVEEARHFLRSFLADVEADFGVKLSLAQACEIAKNNIHLFDLSTEEKDALLEILDLFATDEKTLGKEIQITENFSAQEVNCEEIFHSGWKSKIDPIPFYLLSSKSVEVFSAAILCLLPNLNANRIGNELIFDGRSR